MGRAPAREPDAAPPSEGAWPELPPDLVEALARSLAEALVSQFQADTASGASDAGRQINRLVEERGREEARPAPSSQEPAASAERRSSRELYARVGFCAGTGDEGRPA